MKIQILHKIRNKEPNFGNLENIDKKIEYESHDIYKITEYIKNNLKNKGEEFELYALGPNSILVSTTYILSKLGYKFKLIPKPTDSEQWGWLEDNNSNIEFKSKVKYIGKKILIENSGKACIVLSGKYNIDIKSNQVYMSNDQIVINKDIDSNGLNVVTLSHKLTLDENNYRSLATKSGFLNFQIEIEKILLELSNINNLKEIHIISSIPAIGLLYLGEAISKFDINKDISFFIYNYLENDIYQLGNILNKSIIQEKKI